VEVNFLTPNILWPRRLPGDLSSSLLGSSVATSDLEVGNLMFDDLSSGDNAAREDFRLMNCLSLLPDAEAVGSPDVEFEASGFGASLWCGRIGFVHTRLLHTNKHTSYDHHHHHFNSHFSSNMD